MKTSQASRPDAVSSGRSQFLRGEIAVKSNFVATAVCAFLFCLMPALASAQEPVADRLDAADVDTSDSVTDVDGDFIFGGGMELANGGATCASATRVRWLSTYVADTTSLPDWIIGFGPIPAPAHDAVYSFKPGPGSGGKFTALAADFDFVMYVIASCSETGMEPAPLVAIDSVGESIDLQAAGLVQFQRYYLVVTGLPSAGSSANGTVTFTSPWVLAIDTDP